MAVNVTTPIAALKPGDFGGLGGLEVVVLSGNALGALPERVLEPLTGLTALDLSRNPGSAGFLPRADAGADLTVSAGGTVTLGGPGTGRDPWGTNADYRWVEVDADGNEVVAARTEGLSGESAREARFTAPALAEERVLRYRLAVQGRGHNGTDAYSAADTVTVTVRAAPTVTAVALTSLPRAADGKYRAGERIEVGVTFSTPVTVTGVPRIGLEVGTQARRAFFVSKAGPAVLLFSYAVAADEEDGDGIAVPANGIRLAGGTIADAYGAPAFLDHDAVAADAAHKVDGSLDEVLTGGVCERTPQVRDALVAKAQANDPLVTNCSKVGDDELAGIAGTLRLGGPGIAALKPGDFAGLSGVTGLFLNSNALSALPAGVFDGLGAAVTILNLTDNALGAGSLEDGVFEPLTGLVELHLSANPGSASFVPKADAGEDLVLRAGKSAMLGGPGTGGGPWGTNVEYAWVEVDAQGNPVADADRAEGLLATDVASPNFTASALTAERVVRYRLAVQGRGHGGTDAYSASDTVTVTVRAAPAVTTVALTSVPQADATYREGERIEVSVTFSAPVTVTGTPTIGLEVGTVTREAAHLTRTGPTVLVFGYTVTADDTDDDGIAVPANGLRLAGGTIVDGYGAPAFLGHDAVAADAAYRVDGSTAVLTGGVCDRTPQVRDALLAKAQANDPLVTNCSKVGDDELAGIAGTLRLGGPGIAALKPGDFAGLSGVTGLFLNSNALSALPAGVFDGLGAAVTVLNLTDNALGAGSIEDGVFEPLTGLDELHLSANPGSASFVPKADAGENLVLRAGEAATLGGPGTGRDPWGTNADYAWVEVDADDNPVAETERTEGLSAADVARPGFTAPALTEERVLRYRLAVQGRGHGRTDAYTATDTVTVTVREGTAVTAVVLTSAPQNRILPTYRAGERIEVSVTFSAPVTVTGTPTIGLEVGPETRPAAYFTSTAPNVLLFSYPVASGDTDEDGIAVPANGILLAGGTIVDAQGGAAGLGHDAVAADAAHKVNGGMMALIGGVCNRTPEVREALEAHANAKNINVTHCSHVGDDDVVGVVVGLDKLDGALDLSGQDIAALKPGDFAGLIGVPGLDLSGNALSALPAGVFQPLTGLMTLDLSGNPGSASFVPKADAGSDLVLRADESATLGGPGTGGGPWGTNVDYAWVEVDADENPVADAARTEGLSATDVESPNFTAPALAAERVVRYRFTVTGKGAATEGDINLHRASDTVTVTVRAAPAVTVVALTSVPRADGTYRRGETIEVSVTFSAPVTVTGPPAMTPTIGLEMGTKTVQAAYVRTAGLAVLVFEYTVTADDADDDGIAVPADGILLAGGTIGDVNGAALLGHDAVAADAVQRVDGSLPTGGICGRTPQVRDALVAKAQANDAAVTDCSKVGDDELGGIAGTLRLGGPGIAALKPGDFAGLSGVTGLFLNSNALSALPAGVFDGLGAAVTFLNLTDNALGAGSIEDGVFEPLTGLDELHLSANPGSASFVPKADAGENLVLRAGETATLGGSGTGGGPWGTNVEYAWVEVDTEGNPVAEAARTAGLSGETAREAGFTARALTEERVLRYRLAVQGRGHGRTDAHTATDTVTVTVRAAPAVTAVALASVPQADATYREGERIEVSVTFSAPVTVTGTPTIGLEVGTETRPAAYARNAGPAVLLFSYAVASGDVDADGVAVPADRILLAGGTIAGPHGVALLGHDAVATDAAHMVDGSDAAPTGGVCDRTPQVRDALVAKAKANRPAATDCSLVTTGDLAEIEDTLLLNSAGIAALKADDFAGLTNEKFTGIDLSGNALSALPAGVFDPLPKLTALHLNSNALAEGGLPDGVFEELEKLTTLDLRQNPGSASFVPNAKASVSPEVVRAHGIATLDGMRSDGGPWGENIEYEWVEVDAQGNEVAAAAVTEGLSDETKAEARFTAPVLTEERVLRYRLTVTGRGAATRGTVNRHSASATVQVTVRPGGPALIGVAVPPRDPAAPGQAYGIGNKIQVTASFGEAVTVTGAPVLALDLGGVRRETTDVSGSGTADLVFTYTVKDTDPEAGIGFPANPVSLPTGTGIVTVAEPRLAVRLGLAATAPAVRMDGVRPALDGMELPEVLGLTLKLIYHEALDEDSVPAAGAYEVTAANETVTTPLPVSAVGVKGNTVTLTLARAPGVSQMVTMTYRAPESNPVRDQAGNNAEALTESQKVKSVPTVSVGAVYPKVAPGLGDVEFRVTVSQAPASDLAVMLSFEQADEYLAETTATITIPAGRTSATRTFGIANDYTLASGALTATIAGVGDGYALAPAPGNAATVQVVVVNPPFIVKWDKNAYTVTEGGVVEATVTLRTAAGVPKPRNDYHVALISLSDSAEAGDDYPDVSLTLAVPPADWKADGAGFAASVPVSVATVNDSDVEADERFYLAVASSIGQLPLGLECPAELRNVGGATSCSTAVTIEDDEFGVTGVTVTSMPQKASDTYGARENIEFAVAFNRPVTVTGAPVFYFRLGTGTLAEITKTATWFAGSGTNTLLFSYAVQGGTAGDLDTDGISWPSGSLAHGGGTIVRAGGTAVPSRIFHAQPALTDHKVDGRTTPAATATVTVAVISAPLLTASGSTTEDTYGRQETIEIAVTASEAVEVIGDPVFRFTIGTELVRATYDRGSSTATRLVFTYTVQAGDMGPDGISIGDGSTTFELDSNDRIRTVAQRIDIDSSHTASGTLTGHRVDGSRIADDRDPELVAQPDGAKVFTDQLTLTYDEALDGGSVPAAGAYEVTATNGGVTTPLPVSAVAVDGLTVTLTLATPAAHGQTVRLTYTVPASNPLQDLAENPAGALTNHPVENVTIVLPVVSISAVHPKAAPLLADAEFRLTASPAPESVLAVTLSIAPDDVYLSGTTRTVTIAAGQTSATGTFPIANDYSLASGPLTLTVTGGGPFYLPALAPANAATVQVVVVNPPIVAQWAENTDTVDEGEDGTATLTLKTAADVPKPRAAYKVKVFTTNSSAVAGDDYTALSTELTVEPANWRPGGGVLAVSVPVTVETLQDLVLEGEERFRLQVSAVTGQAPLGIECGAGLEDLGGAGRCATVIVIDDDETLSVTGVTVSSTPAAGTTYLGGEAIEFTATFTAPVTVTGTPTFAFTLGEAERQADYATGSESLELVFSYIVKAGEIDTDGISWRAGALALGEGGTVRLTTTDPNVEEDAALKHDGADAQGEHRVDADPPGVKSVTMQETTLRLLYDEALDPASRPAASAYTLAPGGNPTMVAISGSTVTLTFASAPAEGATVTLAYAAPALNPVKDAGGNPAPAFTGLTVVRGPVVIRIDVGPTPTPNLAMSYGYTKAQLSSNVLGLRGYKLHEMTAHGEGATLTFKVLFDRVVTVTGAPTLKLDLWGETRTARYVSGSGTNTLTFTWGPVSTGDNDFDGIEVKALVLAGASIVDAGNAESMFVAESFGGEHFPQHKIFGGFHKMSIEVGPEAEAVEGERYAFSVTRSIEESRDPESHYVLVGITDSAFPGIPALGRHEGSDNGPGGRTVTFDKMASEGRRANTEDSSLLVIPPVHEDTAGGRTMTIALHTTHFTVRNEHGELAHRIYMPQNLEGVTVPVRVSVSGRRAATVTVSMASTPRLKSISTAPTADTYGRQETIEIAVAASAAVEVVGDPVFRFTIGADPVRAAYDRVNSTATRLLFTYTVQAGDMGPDGISIGDGSTTFELDSNDRIRTAAQRIDIDRSHPAPGTLSGHKVDGSRIADNTAPELVAAPDGATVFTDELTLTYDEALDEGSVPDKGQFKVSLDGGTAQAVSAVAVDGSEVTLTLATPALLGETVTLTYTVPAANPLRDRFGNLAGALTNHPVTNETTVLVVLPVVSIEAVHAKAAPLLADAQFRLTASPAPAADLAVTLSIAQAGAYLASTAQTVTIAAGQTSATGTFPIAGDYTLASGGLTATVTGGGRIYVPAAGPANAATVQVVVADPPIVAQWAEDAYEVAEGKDATAALTLKTAAGVPKPRADYKVKVFTTNDSAVAADDFTAVSGEVTVQPGDWTADGDVFAASVPATVETVGDSLLEGEERFRLQVSAVTGQTRSGSSAPPGSGTWAARGDARPSSPSTTTRPCR